MLDTNAVPPALALEKRSPGPFDQSKSESLSIAGSSIALCTELSNRSRPGAFHAVLPPWAITAAEAATRAFAPSMAANDGTGLTAGGSASVHPDPPMESVMPVELEGEPVRVRRAGSMSNPSVWPRGGRSPIGRSSVRLSPSPQWPAARLSLATREGILSPDLRS
eukprot:scaffold142072_cov28-Tisochrysis_lutea.AAC.2